MKGLSKVEALETLIVDFEHKLKNCGSDTVSNIGTLLIFYTLSGIHEVAQLA